MGPPQAPPPRVALARWLAQLQPSDTSTNSIRRVERSHTGVVCTDTKRMLRGLLVADGLVITRKRTFYRIAGARAEPISLEEVAANYNLEPMQEKYREATDAWKNKQRRNARKRA